MSEGIMLSLDEIAAEPGKVFQVILDLARPDGIVRFDVDGDNLAVTPIRYLGPVDVEPCLRETALKYAMKVCGPHIAPKTLTRMAKEIEAYLGFAS